MEAASLIVDGNLVSNTATDVLKMTVVNRYKNEDTRNCVSLKISELKKAPLQALLGMILIILLPLGFLMKQFVKL